jgi:hypothetical protein
VVLAAIFMIVMLAMVAFAIDLGYVANLRTEVQRAADAGAFAAAGRLVDGAAAAEQTARQFVAANLVGGDQVPEAEIEVEFGEWNFATKQLVPSAGPPSAVRVFARQVNQPLFFGHMLGMHKSYAQAEAIATYRPRDIMVVLDYSASMNDDSELKQIGRISRADVEANLRQIYDELGAPKFGNLPWRPQSINSTNVSTVKRKLGLDRVKYPYPSGSWDDYIRYVMTSDSVRSAGYRRQYGGLTLVNYWLERQPRHDQTPDLWKTSQQPITAVKDSVQLFLAYLQEVQTNDRIGLAVYTSTDGTGTLETGLTDDYQKVEDISRQRQAGHYHSFTNIGAGLAKARKELEDNGRPGALKMIVLMTDGVANRPTGTSQAKAYVNAEADKCAKDGFPVVTVSLGTGADKDLMQSVADKTSGVHFNIPGGQSVAQYEEELKDVFREIADHRPLLLVQ